MSSRILVVSPHLDDAVLSAGSRIHHLASEGAEVTVFTLFAGIPPLPYSPIAEYFHYTWGLDTEPMEHRREEDRKALARLGATPVHGEFLDAVYRRLPDGGWLIDVDGPMVQGSDAAEPQLCDLLTRTVAELAERTRPELVLTSAAVGNHIDHRRTRDAVVTAVAGKVPVRCWEDLPYGLRGSDIPPLPDDRALLDPMAETAGDASWSAKYEAIECYRSQHSMLWPPDADFRDLFDAHATGHVGGAPAELFWPVGP
ncbi:PIG-L deacetylase family protein [Streptomyces violaceusniger]|uniref:PIG-L deacetylase family protein n=1 Tax=Streptomyces violaceusniger TaxID=68280 RepID=UPI0009962221|nr:PIG-L family deacetylase [Streptomyces hygroscopicus]AQW53958.1 Pseudoaglycone Deacetylase Dbv21 [Streptomyces hygroscopicus]